MRDKADSWNLRMLIALVIANVGTSVLHYVDNVANFAHYPEPTWLNPYLIDIAWFVMTPFGILGCWMYGRGRRATAFSCLYIYTVMGLMVLGHYIIAPPWELSSKINLFIIAEAVAALTLGVFVAWLQLGSRLVADVNDKT